MNTYLDEYNLNTSLHGYCASPVSASSIYTSPSFKPSRDISSSHSFLFNDSTNNIDVAVGTLIFNNGFPFRTCASKYMADIIFKVNKFPRE